MNKLNKLKTAILLTTVLLTGMLFTSCSNDDDSSEPSIVGTWLQVSGVNETFRDNVSEGRTNETIDADNFIRVTLNADGTFTEFYSESYNGEVKTTTDKGTYVTNGNMLSLTYEGEDQTESVEFTLTETELTTVFEEGFMDGGAEIRNVITMTFARQ